MASVDTLRGGEIASAMGMGQSRRSESARDLGWQGIAPKIVQEHFFPVYGKASMA